MPPTPYRFAGRVEHDGKSQFILLRGTNVVAVSQGQILEDGWRVEAASAEGVTLMYLPLKQKVSLSAAPATAASASTVPATAVSASTTPSDLKPAHLSWAGPRQLTGKDAFSVALRVSSSEPLRSSLIALRFDPGVLEPVLVRAGKYYEEGGFSHQVDDTGLIDIKVHSRNPGPAANAELVVVTFKPIKAAPAAEVAIQSLSLQDRGGRTIPIEGVSAFRMAFTP